MIFFILQLWISITFVNAMNHDTEEHRRKYASAYNIYTYLLLFIFGVVFLVFLAFGFAALSEGYVGTGVLFILLGGGFTAFAAFIQVHFN